MYTRMGVLNRDVQYFLRFYNRGYDQFMAMTDFQGLGFENDSPGDVMMRAARAKVDGNPEIFSRHMATLLEYFVLNKMNTDYPMKTIGALPHVFPLSRSQDEENPTYCVPPEELAMLYDLYAVYEDPLIPAPTPERFTLPRLSLAFPFETAMIRRLNPDIVMLPGLLGSLDPALAFPGAALIIPTSWTAVIDEWQKWFFRFLAHSGGHPFSDVQERRAQRFCKMLLQKATDDERMMNLLGVQNLI